jgi:biopolymer transport protein ExbD
MRRFSQRSALVTLSEINITPLLDLAFVLLIIFVITTPLLEQGFNLKPPVSSNPDPGKVDPRDVRTVEINSQGAYMLNRQRMSIDQIQANLLKDSHANQNLVVYIRGDEMGHWKDVFAVMDFCAHNGIKMSLRGQPPKR